MPDRLLRCVSVGGTDSAGAAGLAADLRTFHAFGVHGSMVVSAVTVQSTTAVQAVFALPGEQVARQLRCVLEDPGVDAVEIGLMPRVETVLAVAQVLKGHSGCAGVVVDPIVVSSTGGQLVEPDAARALVEHLLPLASLVTPNCRELEVLVGRSLPGERSRIEAARQLHSGGVGAVLITGGEGEGSPEDLLITREQVTRVVHPRVEGGGSRGGGCTHAAALTVLIAAGWPLAEAAWRAQAYVASCIGAAIVPGRGEARVVQLPPSFQL